MINDHLVAYANAVAEIALVYVLWHDRQKYLEERRSIRSRIAVNLEVTSPRAILQPVYGFEKIMGTIPDFIDRVRNPEPYADIHAGNEILIVGASQTGKKTLALEIARAADIDRAIIVYNPRDVDTLAEAKKLIDKRLPPIRRLWRATTRALTRRPSTKDLLLLPNLNEVNGKSGEAWLDQLEALIETASRKPHVLVVGTTDYYQPTNNVASWFGTVLELPRQEQPIPAQSVLPLEQNNPEWQTMVQNIAKGYLATMQSAGYHLEGIKSEDFIKRTLGQHPTPAEIQDIFVHCQTQAVYNRKIEPGKGLAVTPAILDTSISRVIRPETPHPKHQHSAQSASVS